MDVALNAGRVILKSHYAAAEKNEGVICECGSLAAVLNDKVLR